ncbi:MAG: hypothetical protein ACXVAX_08110 [Pseudobdellovibrio sp.]
MKHNSLQLAIEIKTKAGAVLKPHEIHFWELHSQHTPSHLKKETPHEPFKFYTDAILALCFHKMTDYKNLNAEQKTFAEKSYEYFDHYTELYHKSAPRVKSLSTANIQQKKHFENFEKKITAAWEHAFTSHKISFNELSEVLNCISEFENHISSPLIYNFSVFFSAEFTEKLICFYSLLFHLRSVVAIDHNAHVEDSSHETVKCDSISDYLPKSDYTVNDALLYWHFKNLSSQFTGNKKHGEVETNFVTPMHHYFLQYSHNACNLVDQLPLHFLESLKDNELEEALHHVQMDWLLGSASGLLFKIREELFGVLEGYDKIFWHEATNLKTKKASHLNLCFELTDKHVPNKKAA